MRKINYRSSFDFILRIVDCNGTDIGFPPFDFTLSLYTTQRLNAYIASSTGGVHTNCFNDNGQLHIVCKDHKLSPGVLNIGLAALHPDAIYPDGIRNTYDPLPVEIELTTQASDCFDDWDVQLTLPVVKLTYDDLTPEQIAELQRPAIEAAGMVDKAIEKAEAAAKKANDAADSLQDELDKKANRTELSNIISVESDAEVETVEPDLLTTAVRMIPQVLTTEQQAQAKTNIGVDELKVFNDMWKMIWGQSSVDHSHLDENGNVAPYYGNGLWMTYEEALAVYNAGYLTNQNLSYRYAGLGIRTCLPPQIRWGYSNQAEGVFRNCAKIERISASFLSPGTQAFIGCSKLLSVHIVAPNRSNSNDNSLWQGCVSLQTININTIYARSFSLADSPLITLETLQGFVSKAQAGSSAFTITVHPDVYAKLTDENNTPWHSVLTAAQAKNITFATV